MPSTQRLTGRTALAVPTYYGCGEPPPGARAAREGGDRGGVGPDADVDCSPIGASPMTTRPARGHGEPRETRGGSPERCQRDGRTAARVRRRPGRRPGCPSVPRTRGTAAGAGRRARRARTPAWPDRRAGRGTPAAGRPHPVLSAANSHVEGAIAAGRPRREIAARRGQRPSRWERPGGSWRSAGRGARAAEVRAEPASATARHRLANQWNTHCRASTRRGRRRTTLLSDRARRGISPAAARRLATARRHREREALSGRPRSARSKAAARARGQAGVRNWRDPVCSSSTAANSKTPESCTVAATAAPRERISTPRSSPTTRRGRTRRRRGRRANRG